MELHEELYNIYQEATRLTGHANFLASLGLVGQVTTHEYCDCKNREWVYEDSPGCWICVECDRMIKGEQK